MTKLWPSMTLVWTDADIAARTAALVEKHLAENDRPEVKKLLLNCIDLTDAAHHRQRPQRNALHAERKPV